MNKFKFLLTIMLMVSFISYVPLVKAEDNDTVVEFTDNTNIIQWAISTEVPVDKEWEIKFNKDINNQIKLSDFIYVLDSSGTVVEGTDVAFDHVKKTIVVQAPVEGYATNSAYTLVIEEGISTSASEKLISTIHKKFTTNDESSVIETFEPRADATNKIEVVDSLYQIPIANVLSEDYESSKVMISKDTLYMVGDYISLPETEKYPFGFVGQITAVEEQVNSYIYTIITPNLTDVVTNIDISQTADVEAKRVVLSDDLFIDDYSDEFRKTLRANSSFARIVETEDGFKIVLSDLGAEVEGKIETDNIYLYGNGGIAFSGDIEFTKPRVYADVAWFSFNRIGFTADQTFNLNAKAYGNFEGVMEFTLAEVPVPYLGIKTPIGSIGTVLELRLVLEAKADGTIEYSIKQTIREKVEVEKKKNGFEPNASVNRVENKASLDSGRIDLSMDKGFNVALVAKIAQWDIASIGLRPTISTTVSAGMLYENSLANACYELSADLRFRIKAEVSIFDDYVYENFDKSYNLAKLTDCFVNELKFKEKQIIVKNGDRKKLELTANIGSVEGVTLALPHQYVSFSSTSRYVTVDNTGTYHVSALAPDNLAVTITVRMKYGEKTNTANVKLIVKEKEQLETESVESLKFAQNFKITNTGDSVKRINIKGEGYAIIISKDGKIYNQTFDQSWMDIPSGGYAILSYFTKQKNDLTSPDSTISIEQVSDSAFQVFRLYEDNKLHVKNANIIDNVNIFTLTAAATVGEYSFIKFKADSKIDEMDYRVRVSKYYKRAVKLNKMDELIMKNMSSEPLIVFVPSPFSTAKQTSEELFIEKKIVTNEVVKITTSEPNSSRIYLTSKEPEYFTYQSLSLYKNGSVESLNNNKRESYIDYTGVSKDSELYLKNISTVPIVLMGSAKYVKIETVQEDLIYEYTIKPGEKVKVTSTEPEHSFSSNGSNIRLTIKDGMGKFDSVSFKNNQVVSGYNLEREVINNTRIDLLPTGGELYLENVGESPIGVYGPAKYLKVESVKDVVLLNKYTLLPGKSVTVTTTEPVYSTSKFSLNATSVSAFTMDKHLANGEIKKYGNTFSGKRQLEVEKGGYSVLKNTGNSIFTVYAPGKYITFK